MRPKIEISGEGNLERYKALLMKLSSFMLEQAYCVIDNGKTSSYVVTQRQFVLICFFLYGLCHFDGQGF